VTEVLKLFLNHRSRPLEGLNCNSNVPFRVKKIKMFQNLKTPVPGPIGLSPDYACYHTNAIAATGM
jgi:hypothetical protein